MQTSMNVQISRPRSEGGSEPSTPGLILISRCERDHLPLLPIDSGSFLHSVSVPCFTLCPLTCAGGDHFWAFLFANLE